MTQLVRDRSGLNQGNIFHRSTPMRDLIRAVIADILVSYRLASNGMLES